MSVDQENVPSETKAAPEEPQSIPLSIKSDISIKAEKTGWQKFEDWFWCDNHAKFQEQCQILNPYYQKDMNSRVKCLRIVGMLFHFPFSVLPTVIAIALLGNGGGEMLVFGFVALTTWGLCMTFIWFCMAIHVLRKKEQFMAVTEENKYNPFWLWKWYTVLFEMTFVANFIVSIIYWTVIYIAKDVRNSYSPGFQVVSGYIHAMPLICFLFEYSVNTMPIVKRHFFLMPLTGFIYNCINLSHAKITGTPVYDPVLMWDRPYDYFFGLGVVFLSCLVIFIIYLGNQKKLRNIAKFDSKHGDMADICETNMRSGNSVSNK